MKTVTTAKDAATDLKWRLDKAVQAKAKEAGFESSELICVAAWATEHFMFSMKEEKEFLDTLGLEFKKLPSCGSSVLVEKVES